MALLKLGRLVHVEKRNKELVEWWLLGEKLRKKILVWLALKRKRKHCEKERKKGKQ